MGYSYIYSNFILLFMIVGGIALLYCLLHEGARRWAAGGLTLVCAAVVVWYVLPFHIPVVNHDRSSVDLHGNTGLVEVSEEQRREIIRLCNDLTYARRIGESGLRASAEKFEYIELNLYTGRKSVGLWLSTNEEGFPQYDGVYGINTRGDVVRNPQELIAYLKSIMSEEAFYGVEPVETRLDFDLDAARDMILDWDRNMAWLSTQDTLSREEGQAFRAVMEDIFPNKGGSALWYLFNDTQGGLLSTQWERVPTLFYPTLFHQGVELVSAQEVLVEEFVGGMALSRDNLVIRTAYCGENEAMADFYREYIFIRHGPEEDWQFERFGGSANLSGEEFGPDFLPLREGTIESPLDGT